jgi:ABC-type Zn uptake system ZnuABC Zn-binding protein ZnuA
MILSINNTTSGFYREAPSSVPARSRLPLLLILTGLLLATAGLAAACGGKGEEKPPKAGPRVVTSIELFADLIRQVAGERAQITALVPAGADPHTYEPVPSKVVAISEADLVLINGLGFEETLLNVIKNNVRGGVPIIEMSAGPPVLEAGNQGTGNPHLWLNVRYAMHYVEVARDALIQVDPAGEAEYGANAQAYLAELEDLDGQVGQSIASIPAERRKLIVYHDAFPYLAERYGLEMVAAVVRSPGQEPSAAKVADLTKQIRTANVPAVFKEPQLSARVLELAAKDAGVEVCTLYSDAFQGEVDSYVKLMQFDASELVRCLGR